MPRRTNNRPLLAGITGREERDVSPGVDFELGDEVDNYVSSRQEQLAVIGEGSDSEDVLSADEPEVHEHEILPLDVSDSEGGSDSDEGDDEDEEDEEDDGKDWGGRRKMWYGGDTHEYEVMEQEEKSQALKEEEEEAIRLQKQSLSNLRDEDFGNEYEDDVVQDEEEDEGEVTISADKNIDNNNNSLNQEFTLLLKESIECEKQLSIWEKRSKYNQTASILFNLYSSFICNIAFLFSLKTDPNVPKNLQIKKHPVISRIVRIRSLITEALRLPDVTEKDWDNIKEEYESAKNIEDREEEEKDNDNEKQESKEKVLKSDTENHNIKKKKKKQKSSKKRKKSTESNNIDEAEENDDDAVSKLIFDDNFDDNENSKEIEQDRKRRKLNQLIDIMERNRKNKENRRMASVDMERIKQNNIRRSKMFDFDDINENDEVNPTYNNDNDNDNHGLENGDEDDDAIMNKMSVLDKKKEKNQARKARRNEEMTKPHVYTFNDKLYDDEDKRKATTQIVKNRGLTRYRPRDKKTPRARNKANYKKAMKKRRSTTKEYEGKPGGGYSGESTGINISTRRGSKLSSV